MVVLDANILIRAVLGRRVAQLLDEYSRQRLRFCAPMHVFEEAAEYLPDLLRKRGKSDASLKEALDYLKSIVEPVDQETYELFENAARLRIKGRDEDDWPVLATALALGCPIWSEDTDFFGTGAAVWTTDRIEIYLKAELERSSTWDE